MRFFRIYYEYYSFPGEVYSVLVPVVGDPEYSWRMSPLNVPHTKIIKMEEVSEELNNDNQRTSM
jgi:hypothetical protein